MSFLNIPSTLIERRYHDKLLTIEPTYQLHQIIFIINV